MSFFPSQTTLFLCILNYSKFTKEFFYFVISRKDIFLNVQVYHQGDSVQQVQGRDCGQHPLPPDHAGRGSNAGEEAALKLHHLQGTLFQKQLHPVVLVTHDCQAHGVKNF